MNRANPAEFELPSPDASRAELESRIASLRALAVAHDDPEIAVRLNDFILVLEVRLLETP